MPAWIGAIVSALIFITMYLLLGLEGQHWHIVFLLPAFLGLFMEYYFNVIRKPILSASGKVVNKSPNMYDSTQSNILISLANGKKLTLYIQKAL